MKVLILRLKILINDFSSVIFTKIKKNTKYTTCKHFFFLL